MLMEYYEPTLNDLREYYKDYFSLGCLACDIGTKFALISLICFLTKQARNKTPNATTWQVIQKFVRAKSLITLKGFLKVLQLSAMTS